MYDEIPALAHCCTERDSVGHESEICLGTNRTSRFDIEYFSYMGKSSSFLDPCSFLNQEALHSGRTRGILAWFSCEQ